LPPIDKPGKQPFGKPFSRVLLVVFSLTKIVGKVYSLSLTLTICRQFIEIFSGALAQIRNSPPRFCIIFFHRRWVLGAVYSRLYTSTTVQNFFCIAPSSCFADQPVYPENTFASSVPSLLFTISSMTVSLSSVR